MKRRRIAWLCAILLIITALPLAAEPAEIPVTDAAGLAAIAQNLSGRYRLDADITLTEPFATLAPSKSAPFTGVLNGNGHTVSGPAISRAAAGETAAGLFGYNAGTIEDLGLEVTVYAHGTDPDALAETYAGGVAGVNTGVISRCSVRGTVTAESASLDSYAGGVAGENRGTIERCSFYGTVRAPAANVAGAGGIAGRNKGTIENCYSVCDAEAAAYRALAGGIAGRNGFAGAGGVSCCWTDCGGRSVTGENLHTVETCFFAGSAPAADGASPLTREELGSAAAFARLNFRQIWVMMDYPVLQNTPRMSGILRGDANADGRVDTADLVWLLQRFTGKPGREVTFEAADLTGDRRVSVADVVALLRLLEKI